MKRRPLNSATLVTATHKELVGVSDGTGAQVEVWMINKCKAQMIKEGLYNILESPKRKGRRKKGEKEQRSKGSLYECMPMNKIPPFTSTFFILVSISPEPMQRIV